MNKGDKCEIFVRLSDEAVDTWKPVAAIFLDEDTYVICRDQNYDKTIEEWEHEPGAVVICANILRAKGPFLAAVGRRKYLKIDSSLNREWTYPIESGFIE